MKRDLFQALIQWKNSSIRKSLLLRGARQVGKTYLIRKFGQKYFENYVEVNFEKVPELTTIFKKRHSLPGLLADLSAYFEQKIIPGKTLLFLDEIQLCPEAIKSLRYFYEDMPKLHVIGAGSLLDFTLNKIPLGVGRLSFLHLYPLSFWEYLSAWGYDSLRQCVEEHALDAPLPQALHEKLLNHLKDYMLLGGMPAVLAHFIKTRNFIECQRLQSDLINTFRADFIKYAKKNRIPHLQMVFDAIPVQLGNKLKYVNIDPHTESRILQESIQLLEMAGLVYRVYHSKGDGLPLGARINPKKFKLIFFDIGLAGRILGIELKTWTTHLNSLSINRGALAEQLVGQELVAATNPQDRAQLYYWHREAKSSNAEVDYLITVKNKIRPIEVKEGKKGSMKSLQMFLDKTNTDFGIKISAASFAKQDRLQNIPLYAVPRALGQ